jgi:YegS/Rv2252/BmrU family lipid kinase
LIYSTPENNHQRWLAIINPNAGKRKGQRDWHKIESTLFKAGIEFKPVFTAAKEHAISITQEHILQGFRNFIVIGGDGTLNEVVNGIFLQDNVPTKDFILAMIPVGTGNDWCRSFEIPFKYKQAIKLIKKRKTHWQDVGLVQFYNSETPKQRYFVNVAGMGYDAIVAAKTNKDKEQGKGGTLLYLKNLFTSLVFYKHTQTVLKVDHDQTYRHKTFSLSVGIGKYNGGGMKQLPLAEVNDGLFDVTLIKKLGKLTVLKEVKNLYDGSFIHHPKVETFRGKNLLIESEPHITLEVDGESLGHSPFRFEIIPSSLQVVAN